MPELIPPSPRVHRSFLTAMAEVQAEGQSRSDDDSNTRQAIRKYASRWADPAEFARYLRELADEARDQSPRLDGRVPQTTLWWVSGEEYLGRISIRHQLTAHLREIGGHIGYDLRCGQRRLPQGDRGQRRHAGGQPPRQAPVLGTHLLTALRHPDHERRAPVRDSTWSRMTAEVAKAPPGCRQIVTRLRSGIKARCDRRPAGTGQHAG
jgi:hypothetical protein